MSVCKLRMDYLYASFLRGQMIATGVVKHAARVYFWEVRAKVQDEYNLCPNKNNTNIDLGREIFPILICPSWLRV